MRQEAREFWASLGHTERPCLNTKEASKQCKHQFQGSLHSLSAPFHMNIGPEESPRAMLLVIVLEHLAPLATPASNLLMTNALRSGSGIR